MRAGGAPDAPSAGTVEIASRQTNTASPVAVASASCSPSMADTTAVWSLVGETITLAALAKETRPMLNSAGNCDTNSLAAVSAAMMRVGATSLDCIDSDT